VFLQSVLGVEYHKILGPFKYHNERIVQCFGLMQVLSSLAVCTENRFRFFLASLCLVSAAHLLLTQQKKIWNHYFHFMSTLYGL
jgi:hypothetical protein